MIAIPFFIRQPGTSESDLLSARSSRSEIRGLARFDDRALVLEWSEQVQVSESGPTRARTYVEEAGQGTCTIPLGSLQAAELHGGWWRPRLEIMTTTMVDVAAMPGASAGRVVLRIARRDRALAREFSTEIRLALADAALHSAEHRTLPHQTDRGRIADRNAGAGGADSTA